jgi:ubiquitin-conjugating enzyme E2 J1
MAGRPAAAVLRLRGGVDQYNMNDGFRNEQPSPMAIKRIHSELAGLKKEPSDFFRAQPLNDDLLDWHFVLLGAENSVFENGLFHGRIMLDQDYPMKPPRVIFLTESGRFEVGVPVCLTITSHHAECWQPSWDIRTALTAIRAFMQTAADGALGGIDSADEDRIELSLRSRARPTAMPCLADCDRPTLALQVFFFTFLFFGYIYHNITFFFHPTLAFQLHIKMHEELAKAAHIQIPSPRPYKVVKSQGCLLGVMSSLLYRAAVTTVTAARLVGGVEVADVVREVWGEDGGDALQAWMLEKESDAQRHLRHQV